MIPKAETLQRPALRHISRPTMSSSGAFNNPVIPGFNPDPSICRVNDDYFLVTSTFEYYPGIPVYHSKDLLQWQLIGHVITRHSQINMRTTEPSGGLWAPTIRYHEGRFYVSVGCTHRFRPKEWVIIPELSSNVLEKKADTFAGYCYPPWILRIHHRYLGLVFLVRSNLFRRPWN